MLCILIFLHLNECSDSCFSVFLCSLKRGPVSDMILCGFYVIFAFLSCAFRSYLLAGREVARTASAARVDATALARITIYCNHLNVILSYLIILSLWLCISLYFDMNCIAMSSHIMLWLHLCPHCCRSVKGGRPKYVIKKSKSKRINPWSYVGRENGR